MPVTGLMPGFRLDSFPQREHFASTPGGLCHTRRRAVVLVPIRSSHAPLPPQVKCKPYFKLRSSRQALTLQNRRSQRELGRRARALDTCPPLRRLQLAHGPPRRRRHRHRGARRRLGAVGHGRPSSKPSNQPIRKSPTSPSTAPRTVPTRVSAPPTTPTTKSPSTSRSPGPLITPPPARPATIRVYWSQDIAYGRAKGRPGRLRRMQHLLGRRRSGMGRRLPRSRWKTAAVAATAAGMIVLRPRATTTPATAAPHPRMSICPPSCPHVVGCGGTYKTSSEEIVWNDNPGQTDGEGTGGGYSTIFPAQSLADRRARAAHRHAHSARGAWSPMSPATPTPTPATTSLCTVSNGGGRHQRGRSALRGTLRVVRH